MPLEVGLSGEIRAVNRIEQRIAEAEKLGYKQIIISKFNKFNPSHFKIEVKQCSKIEEVFDYSSKMSYKSSKFGEESFLFFCSFFFLQ